jgi:hypothetical protein
MRRGTFVACLAVLFAAPPAALAASAPSNPLTPGIPQPQATIPTSTTPPVVTTTPGVGTTTTSGDSGLSGSNAALIAIGALVILGGISLFIWRDARRRAPVRSRAAAVGGPRDGPRPGSKPRAKPRKLSAAERRRRKRGRAR